MLDWPSDSSVVVTLRVLLSILFKSFRFSHFTQFDILYFYNRIIFDTILDKQNYKKEKRRKKGRKDGMKEGLEGGKKGDRGGKEERKRKE